MSHVASVEVSEDGYSLPIEDVLTGRGLCCGKSGSGKTNTVSVIVEKLLDDGLPLMIVDTEGEYFPLAEVFDVLHVGPSESGYDRQLTEEAAPEIVDRSLQENVPVILDVSEFDDSAVVDSLLETTVDALFEAEKSVKKPYLLVVEEIHEYVPQQGGLGSLGESIIRVAKRGRKRGLGICGVSQRPAAVSKDFITQCDWLVWHRLTWKNDVDVVRRILGSEYADRISDLDPGEAFVMADWDDEVARVDFYRKQTRDAGATPGLEAIDTDDRGTSTGRPTPSETRDAQDAPPAELERRLEEKERRIRELEARLDHLTENRDGSGVGSLAREAVDSGDDDDPDPLPIELSNVLVYLTSVAIHRCKQAVASARRTVGRNVRSLGRR